MNYRPIGHMQKQFSSISETVQSSQNSSNSCTVQSLQYRFNTKLMSVRQIWPPRPSSRTRSAHVEQNRWCPHCTIAIRGLRGAIKHTSQLSLSVSGVYRPDSADCRSGCRYRPHQHDQRRRRRRPCSSTDKSQSRHHMDCSPAWVHAESRFCCTYQQLLWTPSRELTCRIYFSRLILSPLSCLAFSFLAFSASPCHCSLHYINRI